LGLGYTARARVPSRSIPVILQGILQPFLQIISRRFR
jgi:hypothetical protein